MAPAAIADVFVSDVSADAMLNRLAAGIAAQNIKNVRVERPTATMLAIHHRYTPGWAVALGIVGAFVFLIGLIFFLVKSTETLTVLGYDVDDGARFTVTGSGDLAVINYLNSQLRPPPRRVPSEPGARSTEMQTAWAALASGRTIRALDVAFEVITNSPRPVVLDELAEFAQAVKARNRRGPNLYRAEALERRVHAAPPS